jgi:hypothetical protein
MEPSGATTYQQVPCRRQVDEIPQKHSKALEGAANRGASVVAIDDWTIVSFLIAKRACDKIAPGFKTDSATVFAMWRNSRIAQVLRMESFLEKQLDGNKSPLANETPSSGATVNPIRTEDQDNCRANLIEDLRLTSGAPRQEFNSPESTWGTLMNALRHGNRPLVISCLGGQLRDQWRSTLKELDDSKMKTMVDSIRSLSNIRYDTRGRSGQAENAYGVVAREDNVRGEIHFQRVYGEWKIMQM